MLTVFNLLFVCVASQTFFEDDSDEDRPPAGSHVEDGRRLEFASMLAMLPGAGGGAQ